MLQIVIAVIVSVVITAVVTGLLFNDHNKKTTASKIGNAQD